MFMLFIVIVAAIILALVLFNYPKQVLNAIVMLVVLITGIYFAETGQIDVGQNSTALIVLGILVLFALYCYVENRDAKAWKARDKQTTKAAEQWRNLRGPTV